MAIVNPTIFGKGGGIESAIVVTVESGSTVTAVNGANVLTAVADENGARLKLTVPGIWAVSATLNGKTSVSKTVVVPEEYPVTLRFETTISKSDVNLTLLEPRYNAG